MPRGPVTFSSSSQKTQDKDQMPFSHLDYTPQWGMGNSARQVVKARISLYYFNEDFGLF